MIQIDFTVRGNHEDPEGNPVPYQRMLNHSWTKAASRYRDWQEYVRAEFLRSKKEAVKVSAGVPVALTSGYVAIPRGWEADVELAVVWANGRHGDLDNVLKGVLDALFAQDKEVSRIEATAAKGKKGRIGGRITITKKP